MGQFSANPDAFSRGAQRRIYARLRAQIEDGTLAAGTRLMSTRQSRPNSACREPR